MEESRYTCTVLVGRLEGKRFLVRLGCRWMHNIKIDLRAVGFDAGYWINLAQNRDHYVRAVMNLWVA